MFIDLPLVEDGGAETDGYMAIHQAPWPGPMAVGSGFRGGAEGLDDFATPGNRIYGAYDATYGGVNEGFRAVRTAP